MAVSTERRYQPDHAHNAKCNNNDDDDDQYDENADEDFNPDTADAGSHEQHGDDISSSSSSEDENAPRKRKHASDNLKKRKSAAAALDDDALDSGDEATIKERKRRKKRKNAATDGDVEQDEDSGGEGGLIKTRAQRAVEKAERREYRRAAAAGGLGEDVTIDVDAVWMELNARSVGRPVDSGEQNEGEEMDADGEEKRRGNEEPSNKKTTGQDPPGKRDEMITITRTIAYAGEITEVEERVWRSSKEGQAWLKAHPDAKPTTKSPQPTNDDPSTSILRPLKRPSLFEPNPSSVVKGVAPEKLRPHTPSRLDVMRASQRVAAEAKKRAEKMTTVQKSALDWQGFVARETGLKEELEGYGKGKQGFLAREAFLDQVAGRRQEQGREARLRG